MQSKKLRLVSLGVLLSALLVTSSMTAEGGINSWTSNGPEGRSIMALAIDPMTPSTLYAGTYGGGVYKSTSGGAGWSAVNTGLPYYYGRYYFRPYVTALAIDPQTPTTLYAGTGGSGVFKSTDGGASWSAVNTGLPYSGPSYTPHYSYVPALAIDPQTPATLYAGTSGSGVFKSTDGGASWNAVNTGLPNYPYVLTVAI